MQGVCLSYEPMNWSGDGARARGRWTGGRAHITEENLSGPECLFSSEIGGVGDLGSDAGGAWWFLLLWAKFERRMGPGGGSGGPHIVVAGAVLCRGVSA